MYPELFDIPIVHWGVKSFGFMMMVAYLTGTWLGMRRAAKVKQDPDLVLNCAFVALVAGVLGGRLFFVTHYWDEDFAYLPNPLWAALDFTAGGLEFYGGLLGGLIGLSAYLIYSGRSYRVYMDIAAPSAMWGLAIGRLGCFLNGCCWGGVCVNPGTQEAALPWAVRFPFGSPAMIRQWENRQLSLPSELIATWPQKFPPYPLGRDGLAMSPERLLGPEAEWRNLEEQYRQAKAAGTEPDKLKALETKVKPAKERMEVHRANLGGLWEAMRNASPDEPARQMTVSEIQRLAKAHPSLPVHPTQIYDTINGLLLFGVLSTLFYRRKRHGIVLGVMLLLYPISRIIMELIRVDNPKDQFGGLTISQAVSVGLFLCGVVYMVVLYRLPLRSPKATEFIPATA